ncbi:MAG: diaminopimelate epimerase [Pseudonocardiales bacterium]|nr:diaminopimelate epimerase [Pseudonocardiales bacterium]
MSHTLRALKGHGTENDFVLLPDPDAVLSMSPSLVRALCDRHAGIGADGVLRVVRTENATEPDVRAQAGEAEFFMDYHNADGSIAEMCGNGVRVFARYLRTVGLVDGDTTIATRGGPKSVTFSGDDVSVVMGSARYRPERPRVSASGLLGEYQGIAIDLPNPHVVVELADLPGLEALELWQPPRVAPELPDGQNVEFVVRTGARRLSMRVHERGVGETRSCGTGICAAVVAAAGDEAGEGQWRVDVPGGRCTVGWTPDGSVILTGPAVLVAEVQLGEQWLAEHR